MSLLAAILLVAAPADSINLRFTTADPCSAEVDELEFQGTDYVAQISEYMAGFDRATPIMLTSTTHSPPIPWRCVGGVIFQLQSMGFTNIRPSATGSEEQQGTAE